VRIGGFRYLLAPGKIGFRCPEGTASTPIRETLNPFWLNENGNVGFRDSQAVEGKQQFQPIERVFFSA